MKNITLLLMVLTISQWVLAQKTVTVNNAKQFVSKISSNVTLQLKDKGIYYISDVAEDQKAVYDVNYVSFQTHFDGIELVITGAKNLTIKGAGSAPTKLITKPQYGNVIVFKNCENITLDNLDAGHGPEKGTCRGGVFVFENCTNINIKNCILYGSGMEGLTTSQTANLTFQNSVIRGCTYGIMTLENSSDFKFINSTFEDNQEFDLVNITKCAKITFDNVKFYHNSTNPSNFEDGSVLFNVTDSEVTLKNSVISSNSTGYCFSKNHKMKLTNNKIENNNFRKGETKDK